MTTVEVVWDIRQRQVLEVDEEAVAAWAIKARLLRSATGAATPQQVRALMARNRHFQAFVVARYAQAQHLIPARGRPAPSEE